MSTQPTVPGSEGIPFLPVHQTLRVMALEMAVRTNAEWSGRPEATEVIVDRAKAFEAFIKDGT